MKENRTISKQTLNNWWIDLGLFLGALAAMLSGVYFLYLPEGGYMGGRNPTYGIEILFERHTWEDIHMWGGIAMIAIALVHLVIHWSWVVSMTRRMWSELRGKGSSLNARGRWNLVLNTVVAISFFIAALSGLYFLFAPGGRGVADPMWLFTRTAWDLIHTWAGVVLTGAAVIHFAIHWAWAVKVTGKVVGWVLALRLLARTTNLVQ